MNDGKNLINFTIKIFSLNKCLKVMEKNVAVKDVELF